MDSFYVVLPSNTGNVEGNTTSRFTVRMPDTLELDSSWTVALSNIIYPFSFSLIGDSDAQESITIFRRYGDELLPIRIEIPDLSFASEEALEEAINAVLLDAWKKELDRERLEKEMEERRKELRGEGYEYRKRRAVESIREQFDKNGYFDLNIDELNPFIKLLFNLIKAFSSS
uniref:CS domain-containing protein n=1 Tax=Meloidogyne hapla TaxID=6305 RepID=A0A1I8B7C4_MELHA